MADERPSVKDFIVVLIFCAFELGSSVQTDRDPDERNQLGRNRAEPPSILLHLPCTFEGHHRISVGQVPAAGICLFALAPVSDFAASPALTLEGRDT